MHATAMAFLCLCWCTILHIAIQHPASSLPSRANNKTLYRRLGATRATRKKTRMIENNPGESNSNDDQAPLPRGSRSSPDGDGDCQRLPHPGRGPDGQLYPISRSTKLERHGTATSEHSSSSKSSYPNRSGSNAAPFPNSPALSTFSKIAAVKVGAA
ncbi:hypothetical protein THAOC_08060 [Thalassiosira oceanica]|uniref:Secreted protein n=1 Tax=Thalassiosira oceanica TaxID=159749 RepID=K0TAU6_THAOC|nr:hypothetical protein THAOC_08060 [Thalassiosira oceanica]|eukprot:EJK70571.1 hypothetical protein THAOC_08060 [Thalassiosira oceanica]